MFEKFFVLTTDTSWKNHLTLKWTKFISFNVKNEFIWSKINIQLMNFDIVRIIQINIKTATRNNRWSTIFDINEDVRVSRQSLDLFAIMKFDDKNYLLLYKQKYLLCEKNNRFFSRVNFDDYKITKIVDESIINLIIDDEYTKTILVLLIITKFIK